MNESSTKVRWGIIALFELAGDDSEAVNLIISNLSIVLNQAEHEYMAHKLAYALSNSRSLSDSNGQLQSSRRATSSDRSASPRGASPRRSSPIKVYDSASASTSQGRTPTYRDPAQTQPQTQRARSPMRNRANNGTYVVDQNGAVTPRRSSRSPSPRAQLSQSPVQGVSPVQNGLPLPPMNGVPLTNYSLTRG